MKKTNKIIALILAVVLAFSSVPLMASASAIKDDVNTVEKLIQGENLGNLVEWLLKNLNNRKDKILGTVLRIVFLSTDEIDTGALDVTKATDEQLAKCLIDYLNKNLPTWTADLTKESWWNPVKNFLGMWPISITLDLDDVDGIIKSLYSLGNTSTLGDISKINESALKNVTIKNSGNLGVLKALFQFLSDNTDLFKKALKGQLSLGGLDSIIKGFIDINAEIKKVISPDAIKEMLCDAVGLDYNTYKTYTADAIVAVAFLKLLTGADTVSQNDANDLMNLSIYGFLEKYAGDIYKNLLVGPLNTDVKKLLVEQVKPLDDEYNNILDEVFNWDYNFTGNEFDSILAAGKGNMVAKLNDAVIILLEKILTKDALTKLNLKKGGNENLDENLTKAFRFLLPKLAKIDKSKLGADLSAFTEAKVKNMEAEEMALAVLKLFFPGWFNNSNATELNSVKTLEQLAVLAAKYAATNKEWVPMDIKAAAKATKVDTLADKACIDLIFEIGMEVAAKALNYNKSTTYFELPADTSKWTAEDYLDQIVDWAINFAKGIPAIADILPCELNTLDKGADGFFKLNLILNSLVDLSFISGCGNDFFAFDMEKMLLDKFLGNLLNFDIDDAVAMLAENEEASLFDKKINQAAIDLIDDLLTGLFELNVPGKAGDVDFKEGVKAADARLALRYSVGLEDLNVLQLRAANVDGEAGVKAADARRILRASVNLDTLA